MQVINEFLKGFNLELDLSDYEKLYKNFDEGHNLEHMKRVRKLAVDLAKKHAPNKIKLAYIAATLHDIGLTYGREDHELNGAEMIKEDSYLNKKLSEEQLKEIVHAVAQHRASKGQPKTTLAKIISDADRSASTTSYTLYRSISYQIRMSGKKLSLEEIVLKALEHQKEKFDPNSYGRRVYFKETDKRMKEIFDPILEAETFEDVWDLISKRHRLKIKKQYKKT